MNQFLALSLFIAMNVMTFPYSSNAEAKVPGCEAIRSVGYPDAAYVEHMCQGIEELKNGFYEKAIVNFEKAEKIDFFEAPNFESYSYLAHAHLLSKNIDKYREYIKKSELALSVLTGIFACDFDGHQPILLDDSRVRLEGPFVQEVANEMCAEAYLYIYSPSARTLKIIEWDGKLVSYFLHVKQMGSGLNR